LGGRDPGKGTDHLLTHPQALPTMPVAKEVDEGGQGVVGGRAWVKGEAREADSKVGQTPG